MDDDVFIGCASDDPFDQMHVSGQHYLTYNVRLKEGEGERGDYREELKHTLEPFLTGHGLSGSICYQAVNVEKPRPVLIGFIWRQKGRESLGSMTDSEIVGLKDMLMAQRAEFARFSLTKLITGEIRGSFQQVRRYLFEEGDYSEVELSRK
jgi:hypothetical protein